MCWDLAAYMLWPFGKYVCRHRQPAKPGGVDDADVRFGLFDEQTGLLSSNSPATPRDEAGIASRPASPHNGHSDTVPTDHGGPTLANALKRPGFYIWALLCPILWLLHGIAVFFCGFLVVFIPMAKIQWLTMSQLLLCVAAHGGIIEFSTLTYLCQVRTERYSRDRFTIRNGRISRHSDVHVRIQWPCGTSITLVRAQSRVRRYQAVNVYYYKYTIEGMNICLVNLMAFVVLAIFFGYIDHLESTAGTELVFTLSLLSVIPLAYYIGMSIANISAQSNFAVGAVLNATFGSVVELILYVT